MIKKIILALLVVVAVSGFVYATYGNSGNNNNTTNITAQGTQQTQSNNATQNSNSDKSTQTTKTISSAQAMKIANGYIEVSNATAGTPSLVTEDNKQVYIVPVIENGNTVGEIDIDAQTGENLGGAGGSP